MKRLEFLNLKGPLSVRLNMKIALNRGTASWNFRTFKFLERITNRSYTNSKISEWDKNPQQEHRNHRINWGNIFKIPRESNFQSGILYPARLSIKYEIRKNIFSYRQDLKNLPLVYPLSGLSREENEKKKVRFRKWSIYYKRIIVKWDFKTIAGHQGQRTNSPG